MEEYPSKDIKLTGVRKAAVLLISLDRETAAEVLRSMSKHEVLLVSAEIAKIDSIKSATITSVHKEFYKMIQARQYAVDGGLNYARSILHNAFDDKDAHDLIEKVRSSLYARGFVSLKRADSMQLVNFLIKEHPQTIALILSYLNPEQTAEVLRELPEELRKDVAYRIATLGKISPNLLHEIENVIESLAESVIAQDLSKTGGPEALAGVLNQAGKATERSIISYFEEVDPALAMEVKSQMFIFEDLIMIDDRGIQQILKSVDKNDLAMALKAADEKIREKIFRNLSERAAALLNDDLEVMGPVRLKDVEEAQRKILEVVKQLEEEGEIILAGRGDDVVIN